MDCGQSFVFIGLLMLQVETFSPVCGCRGKCMHIAPNKRRYCIYARTYRRGLPIGWAERIDVRHTKTGSWLEHKPEDLRYRSALLVRQPKWGKCVCAYKSCAGDLLEVLIRSEHYVNRYRVTAMHTQQDVLRVTAFSG